MTIQKLKANRWCLYTSAKEQWRLVALLDDVDGADVIQCMREFEHEDEYGAKSWNADTDHDIDTASFRVAKHLPKTVTEPWATFEAGFCKKLWRSNDCKSRQPTRRRGMVRGALGCRCRRAG